MMPSSTDIRYFVEVATTGHLSKAAIRLGITQPSLTQSIQRLEAQLEESLFVRSRKGMTLTRAGQIVFSKASALLMNWEDIKVAAKKSHTEVIGKIKIGCHSEVAIDSLPLFLPDVLEQYPHLDVTLIHDLSRKILEGVVKFDIDVAIVVNPFHHVDLVIKKLYQESVSLWVGRGNRRIQDLYSNQTVLICDQDLNQSQEILEKLNKNKINIRRVLHSSDLEVILSLVASGAGIGVLPSEVALRYRSLGLRKIESAPTVQDTIALVYHRDNKSIATINKVASCIVSSHVKKYGLRGIHEEKE